MSSTAYAVEYIYEGALLLVLHPRFATWLERQADTDRSTMTQPTKKRPSRQEPVSDDEWKAAGDAWPRLKQRAQDHPVAKAAFERTTAAIDARTAVLRELRQARLLTQTELGKHLGMDQSEVSRLEQRSDLLLSTLQRYVAATGGELRLLVTYPDAPSVEVRLTDPSAGTGR